ncbi:hypothetical protein ACFW95_29530 [Streptomyces sp. NPDC059474]|uniref:hypothetical protein n=1 Tax=Streptomyces sp. NPDC059474 TaxID=3346846 RepID=UPI0036AD7455
MAPVDMGGDLSGRLLGGRYRVTGRLGRGGMGVVLYVKGGDNDEPLPGPPEC